MKRAKHLSAVVVVGTWLAFGCGSDDSGGGGNGGSGGSGASAGTGGASAAGSPMSDDGGDGPVASAGTSSGGADSAGGYGGEPPDTTPVCGAFADMCDENSDCCSQACDMTSLTCIVSTACKEASEACTSGPDCCSFHCVDGTCSNQLCVSDTEACTDNADCCSGKCVNDVCEPLTLECTTGGNNCETNGQCCSKLCGEDGRCTVGASFCIQFNDACTKDEACCSGVCNIAEGALLGTCELPSDTQTFCQGVEGSVCANAAGEPECGDCCSRLCAPYAPTGVLVCQPISGCHSTGELCRSDTDCCGGTILPENDPDRLPGAGNGHCDIEPGKLIGRCTNPKTTKNNPDAEKSACSPYGNVCHLTDYGTCEVSSARANCCGGLGANGICKPDTLGVPRCSLQYPDDTPLCRAVGETCASSDNCCDGVPCTPDAQGVLRCGEDRCVENGGSCTINGDCCPPQTCIRPAGSTSGVCGTGDDPPTCAQYGQTCDGAGDCCNDIPCTNGVCKYAGG